MRKLYFLRHKKNITIFYDKIIVLCRIIPKKIFIIYIRAEFSIREKLKIVWNAFDYIILNQIALLLSMEQNGHEAIKRSIVNYLMLSFDIYCDLPLRCCYWRAERIIFFNCDRKMSVEISTDMSTVC